MQRKFKVQLKFTSLVGLASLIGFCAGVFSIPLGLAQILLSGVFGFRDIIIIAVASPFVGLLNGFLLGITAFPMYYYLSRKVGFRYEGHLYVEE